MNCQTCKTKAKYIEYQTFSYYYCEQCKEEVKTKAEHIQELIDQIPIGHAGQILRYVNGIPTWVDPPKLPNDAIFTIDFSDDLD